MNKEKKYFILSENLSKKTKNKHLIWSGYEELENQISILKYIENNSHELRKRYLKWIYDLGSLKIDNIKLQAYFKNDVDISLWWMSHFIEKNHTKTNKKPCAKDLMYKTFPN